MFGLEVWNAAGQKTVSIAGRITRVHSQYNFLIPNGVLSETVSVPGLAKDGTWAAFVLQLTSGTNFNSVVPTISTGAVVLTKQLGLAARDGVLMVYRI